MLLFAVFAITSCEKEEIKASASKGGTDVQKSLVGNVSISAITGSCCGGIWPCGLESADISMTNAIGLTNNNQTDYPSLDYTFYKYIGMSGGNEIYQPLSGAQYTCDEYHPQLAKHTLTDNTKFLIIANDPAVTAPNMSTNVTYSPLLNKINYNPGGGKFDFKRVTTGDYYGDACGGNGGLPF